MSSTKRPDGRGRLIRESQTHSKRTGSADLPLFCDFSCPHAAFPPADAVGACRREVGVYCSLLKRYNNKNTHCLLTKSRA